MKPPPVINGTRVLSYALVGESVRFTGDLCLYVDGILLGAVQRLVISESLDDQDELFLLHCDDNWNVLGIQAWNANDDPDVATPNDVKTCAENYYAGISSQWIAHGTTLEDARAYYEQMIGEHRCSFCNRTMDDVQLLMEGKDGARICDLCITSLNAEITSDETRAEQIVGPERG
jgi:hypothetical protein